MLFLRQTQAQPLVILDLRGGKRRLSWEATGNGQRATGREQARAAVTCAAAVVPPVDWSGSSTLPSDAAPAAATAAAAIADTDEIVLLLAPAAAAGVSARIRRPISSVGGGMLLLLSDDEDDDDDDDDDEDDDDEDDEDDEDEAVMVVAPSGMVAWDVSVRFRFFEQSSMGPSLPLPPSLPPLGAKTIFSIADTVFSGSPFVAAVLPGGSWSTAAVYSGRYSFDSLPFLGYRYNNSCSRCFFSPLSPRGAPI